jgi:hypothetical protein
MRISRFEGARLRRLLKNSVQNLGSALLGGSPRIHAGEKASTLIMRFSAGSGKPRG